MTDSKTLTLRDVPHNLVREAKMLTGKGTASQALLEATRLFIKQRDIIDELRATITKRDHDLQRSRSLMRQLAPLCVQVAEIAGQKDMFD
ncbi:hypothetical protein G7015_09400 [Pseudomonas kunmingensis]|uniref:hypothetical protein n=1 Tax=Stutzerimonas kunmingensis TaxID=1211807 RepID=UPI0015E2C3EE|nr:hypothetical protein [Stutzerimonas kunmingensis]MBA1238691.1 hypothetical protein [Stutzerimonas kunmingensis]